MDPSDSPDPMPMPEAAADFAIVTDEPESRAPLRRPNETATPRLGIVHLLVWTACCAVFLGLARAMADRPAGVAGAIFLILVAVGDGAAWAGLAITLARFIRGRPWPIEPGQWLLSLLGVVVAVELLAEFAAPRWLRNPQGVVLAAAACAFVVPLFSRRLETRWKWLFGALSLLYAFPLLTSVLDWQIEVPRTVIRAASQLTSQRLAMATAVAVAVLAIFERGGRERPWLLWAGVATAVWLALLPFVAQASGNLVDIFRRSLILKTVR